MTQLISVSRKEHFNAAHRLHNVNLTAHENVAIFGKCNNPNYHGHNYDLIVTVIGPIDPVTSYVIDTKILKDIVKETVMDKFDHKNLNLDTVEFATLNPTTENMAIVIYNLIKAKLADNLQLKITLYETERNFVTYPA